MKKKIRTKKPGMAEFAYSHQKIAESGAPQTNGNRSKAAIVNERIWIVAALGFVMLCILSWLDEILDLPHLLTGTMPTPFNWPESIIETGLIITVGVFTLSIIIRDIAENKKKEKMLLNYHDELETRVKEQTANLLRVNEELRTDITERKKAEEALRESEQKFKDLIETTTDWVWEVDKNGVYTYVSPKVEDLLGHKISEVLGKTPFDFMPVEEAEKIGKFFKEKVINKESFYRLENVNRHKDGHPVVLETNGIPIFDEKGQFKGYRGIDRDITERKKAEETLKYSEERYGLAQRVANIGSWDWDIGTGNLKWSEKIEPMFGFAHGEFGGTYEAFLDCVHPEDRPYVVDSVNACIEQGRNYDIEHRIVWPDGKVRWVSETGNVVRDENNKAIRMLGVVRDITVRKQAEEVLKRDKETFERLVNDRTQDLLKAQTELHKAKRLSDLGTLAATVAHELRNPLGVIRTASYNIRRKRQSSLLDRHLDNIEKKISESDQIINNLLGYARIRIPNYEKIQIYDILNECIAFAKRRFYKQNVSIVKTFESTEKRPTEADPLQIREIFNNILTNAYQSVSDKKGKIEIIARYAKYDRKDSIEISFNDNGMGIDKEDLERVFEPFFTRKSKGTGLGLTICNELVNLHSGKIDIDSQKGKGTTVTVTLPIKRVTK